MYLAAPHGLADLGILVELGFPVALVLSGPVREVRLVPVVDLNDPDKEFQGLWGYPWPKRSAEEFESNEIGGTTTKRNNPLAWFYSDSMAYTEWENKLVKCLTVAKWRREWDGRWYAAGLVLVEHCCYGVVGRLGYFEHSWEIRTQDWDDHGEM